MTEAEWLAATEPRPMLEFLRSTGRADERRLRLFAVACCSRIRHLSPDEPSWKPVEVVERFADGLASREELLAAGHVGTDQVRAAAHPVAWDAANTTARAAAWAVGGTSGYRAKLAEQQAQAALLRCLFGNPFRAPPALPASLLKWGDGTVAKIATTIYQERRWDDVGVLANALEDAGCEEAGVLEHLWGPGPHARGCHVIDLILRKN